ncbi:MAG: hypothetical protein R3266_07535, partial [Gemmatimonadota bacterium]|nr:hypothetical protein [Gemmatimonadota bacterium]
SVFHAWNAVRHAVRGEGTAAGLRVAAAARFALGPAEYWRFPELTEAEDRRGWRSLFHVFAGRGAAGGGLALRLMDPSYEPGDPPLGPELRRLIGEGWDVGLHPSFASWGDADRLRRERDALSEAVGAEIVRCRQHWLRFSWQRTWIAQARAGLRFDTTLGFNDRPGFRTAAALAYRPEPAAPELLALPMVLMDAHLYDYRPMDAEARQAAMDRVLGEIRAVRGQASLLWHQRVLSPDYGWEYEELLDAVERNGLSVMRPEADLPA